MLQPSSRVPMTCSLRCHIHALSDEIVRRVLTDLSTADLRQVAQVCARWHRLALLVVVGKRGAGSVHASRLPWNVLQPVFALLSSADCRSAARVCVSWRLNALCFFSPVLGRRHINNLPGELLDYIFSYLDFESLRMAAQVCLHWRDHGIDHPTFWRKIEATSVTPGALDLLSARLGQSQGRPFSLTIDIEATLRPAAETRLMNLLTAIMPTVQKLDIRLSGLCAISLWRVLNWHAPEMTTFSLKLYNPDRIMTLLHVNSFIFDSLPGKLREVTLRDVTLPVDHGGFPAFSQLRSLTIIHPPGTVMPFPAYFLEICSCLDTLVLAGGRLTFDEQWSPAALEGLSRLTKLSVHVDPPFRAEFVARMPLLKHIPYVVLNTPPDIDAAYDFLDGVGSPFNLGFIDKREEVFYVLVEDDRTGYLRIFIEFKDVYAHAPEDNDETNILFYNDEFPKQVQFLSVALTLWDTLVPYMLHYTGLAKLVISLAPQDPFAVVRLDGKPLAFGALEVLLIDTCGPYYGQVSPGDIIHFVDNVLHARHCRKLELRCMFLHWKDDAAPLYRRFDSITYLAAPHSRPIIRHTILLS